MSTRCCENSDEENDLSAYPQRACHLAGKTLYLQEHCHKVGVWVSNTCQHSLVSCGERGTGNAMGSLLVVFRTPWLKALCFHTSLVIHLVGRLKAKDFCLFLKIKSNLCGVLSLNLESQWMSRSYLPDQTETSLKTELNVWFILSFTQHQLGA